MPSEVEQERRQRDNATGWRIAAVATGMSFALSGCPNNSTRELCSSLPIVSPDGRCYAYYEQTEERDAPGRGSTSATLGCNVDGKHVDSGITGFDDPAHGIGLRWIDANTLELAVPDGVRLHRKSATSWFPEQSVAYTYRTLGAGEAASAGCGNQFQANDAYGLIIPKPALF